VAAFGITPDIREKLMRISPATIDRALKNDRAALALKGKSLTKSAGLLKHRIPIRTFYTSQERKLPGFIQIDHLATGAAMVLTQSAGTGSSVRDSRLPGDRQPLSTS
jgi:hypothetical protein